MLIDALNWKILKCLQENARQSNAKIGRIVGISSPAVSERIKKMEDVGIINGYKTIVSSYEVGYQLKAIITIRAFMGKLKPFLTKVKSFDEVLNCYRITGNENIVMEVMLTNQRHLEQFIDQLISYGETKTQIVLSNVIENTAITKTKLYEI
ncbi:Lrp/AsnC family transcriptional regulator [Flavobacteriaceae bacterium]|jgi:Lrp/AsnC family leucine-responsive transcriptional regulator|nr:Lrp/AsnC family transcriptional regulator [bacterium]MDB9914085.1 Lrp/AsnC family transcriptional regulator [Flavobacteriaceae bacterium]MDB9994245.1 Lrp/AsnC family transcriptional regulator [Flavobacteriaceae bacterium]MDG1330607.1 Lrp/AsnC family transcriptional regulator [Flavobacteriaceae bacterium]|tara:strand:- start:66475 stop:66930 length:456 start_codon:yes stop_codon:yes gene_type:complete